MIDGEVTITSSYSAHTDSILLGYEIGHADTPDGRLSIVASGRDVRFTLADVPGYYEIDLTAAAEAALEALTNGA